jgi:hypothetical protein
MVLDPTRDTLFFIIDDQQLNIHLQTQTTPTVPRPLRAYRIAFVTRLITIGERYTAITKIL